MANYLAERRKELDLTMKEVAEMVGVSEATVSRWESGSIANMKRDKIQALSKALKVRPFFIMTGEMEEERPVLTADDAFIIKNYHLLNDGNKEAVKDLIIKLVMAQGNA